MLEQGFERVSCGGVLLQTCKAREHSPALRDCGPADFELVDKCAQARRRSGFLAAREDASSIES